MATGCVVWDSRHSAQQQQQQKQHGQAGTSSGVRVHKSDVANNTRTASSASPKGAGQSSVHASVVVSHAQGLSTVSNAAGRVYNLGSNEEITIEALAEKIISLTGSRSKKVFLSYEEAYGRSFDDMQRRVPSLQRISEQIGYGPRYSLTQTLELIIESIRQKKTGQ